MRKTMKKVLAMATASAMILSMAGCGGNSGGGAAAPAAGGDNKEAAAPASTPTGAGESSLKGPLPPATPT